MHISQIRQLAAQGAYGFPTLRNWYGWCQAFVAWVKTIAGYGAEPHWYPSARAAWNDSPPAVSMDPYAAPPGAIHFFTAGHPDYDSKISLGRGRLAHAYRNHDFPWPNLINVGEDEWESAAAKAPWIRSTYLGWTYGFGPGGVYTIDVQVDDPIPPGAVRLTNGDGTANAREFPTRTAWIDQDALIVGNDTGDFKARTKGESVNGIDDWFQGAYRERWYWAGSFVGWEAGLSLPLVANPAPSTPTPPAPTPYTFEAFHPVVSDVIPTVLLGDLVRDKAERGNFPARPTKVVIHDFGEVNVHTYGSVINDFTNNNGRTVSSHFVIGWSGDRSHITQMVSLDDRAYHAGPNGNDFVGIEVDPLVNTDTDAGQRIRLDVASLLSALREHYGYDLIRIEHNQVEGAETMCGDDIDLSWWAPVVEPPPIEPDPPVEPSKPTWPLSAIITTIGTAVVAIVTAIVALLGTLQ